MRKAFSGVALLAVANVAYAGCLPIAGTVELTPDASCAVRTFYAAPPTGPFFVGECFAVTLKLGGLLPAHGYAGVTAEPMTNSSNETVVGPVALPTQGGRQVLTARSTFTLAGTRFFAAEVIIDSGSFVTEQSVITGTNGEGWLKGATGGFVVLGDSINQSAPVRGQICTP